MPYLQIVFNRSMYMQYECSTYIQTTDSYTVTPEPTSAEGEHDYCTPVAFWYPVRLRITDVQLYTFCI